MNWLSHILAVLIIVFTLTQIYWQYRITYTVKDARTKSHKKLRTWLLWVTLLLVVINQAVAFIDGHQKDDKARKLEVKIDVLNSNQTSLEQSFNNDRRELTIQISFINSNQSKLSEENLNLLNALTTNMSIAPVTRLGIMDANKQFEVINSDVVDLNAWESELDHKLILQKIQQEQTTQKNVEDERIILEKAYPVFDYTINKFQRMLAEMAKQNGGKILSTYTTLPSPLTNNQHVAEITLGLNTNWSFEIIVSRNSRKLSTFNTPVLSILNQGNTLLLVTPHLDRDARIHTSLRLYGGESINNDSSYSDYKTLLNEILRNLIAAQAKQFNGNM